MYLKSLEIHGFKSFPDKIKLTFDKGITGVVGPNGSGKSNIGDAMRWVLGEQSTKTLRGNKMEDIIFAGTASRKPVGFASVTLTIDNSNHEFDVDGDEVSVMRKLYRSGESEYRINGKSVRLKDINELFMDTGLGRDGYSIIGQGRIAEIVSAKSNERRDIFEEAAGISKFRYKKAEAEKKLALAEDNLVRLNDIVSELESRIKPLKAQAEKAEKFIVLAEKRKKIEISVWVAKLSEIKNSIKKADEQLIICKSQYADAEAGTEKCEEERRKCELLIQECNEKVEEFRREILETEKKSSEYKSGIAVCENDILYCKRTTMSLMEKQTAGSLKKEETQKNINQCEQRKLSVQKQLDDVSAELESIKDKFAQTDREFQNIGKLSDEKTAEINQLYIKQREYRFTVTSSESIIAEINSQLENASLQNSDLKKLREKYITEKNETEESIKGLAGIESELKNKINGFAMLSNNKNNKLAEINQQYNKLIIDMNSMKQKIKIMQDMENSMEGFNYSVKEIIKAASNHLLRGVRGTVAQLISVDDMYSVAIETAVGGALQNIIVNDEQSAKDCIAYLKQHKAGRATFLPVTSVKGYELTERNVRNEYGFIALGSEIVKTDIEFMGIIRSLLGRTVIAEDINSAADIAKKYGYKFKVVTLDGQVVNAGGSFTGGSQSRSAGMLTRKNEIEKLSNELEKYNSDKTDTEDKANKLRSEIEKITSDAKSVQEELNGIVSDRIEFEAEAKRLAAMAEQALLQLNESENMLKQLEKRLETQKSDYDIAVKELETVEKSISEIEDSIESEKTLKENIQKKREELSAKLSELRLNEMEFRKNIELIDGEIRLLNESVSGFDDESRQLAEEIQLQKKITEQKQQEIENLRKKLEIIQKDTENFSAEIEKQHQKQREYENQREKINSEARTFNDTKESLTKELTRLEERRSSFLKESDSVISQIWDNYELTRSEAESIAQPVENMLKTQKELTDIRNSIKSLGSVNVDAVEEYKEVSERYEFMSGQMKDVETSKAELEKLIENLMTDMENMFRTCFDNINMNFRRIFRELFGGGSADLVLTEPDNVLESGIEIVVAPPGKVIKNLIALSGGEQSFIAIALYFAILKIKPAPFCILDEIDAALDDVNVSKYAAYLKNFTDSTQFITVTHRRGTMECANVLYGVTMQENGVSKLLKLDNTNIDDI
ncbi:MAG: chromosome segregation protein SMC [Oscillospiraceae bacterium]